ncbi:MAG: CoA transferase, partial [Planctomycetes bacterium]|nr:CoA transferase [Planctomycetota bacterium]
MMPSTTSPPLAGLRVLELSEGIAGPSAAAYLADLGADVVKVETAEGDPLRGGRGFAAYNRGKRSAVLALDADGTRALSRAVQRADAAIVGEEWSDRLFVAGIAIEDLCERADTVLCTIPPLGSGAAGTVPSDEDVMAAVTGLMWAQAGHEPGPVRPA